MAALLDRHAQQEAESVAQLDFLPAADEESTAPQRGEWWELTSVGQTEFITSSAVPTQPGSAAASDRNHPNGRNKVHTHGAQLTFTLCDDNDNDNDELYLDFPLPQADLYSVPSDDYVPMSVDDSQDLDSEAQVKGRSVGRDAGGQVKSYRPPVCCHRSHYCDGTYSHMSIGEPRWGGVEGSKCS